MMGESVLQEARWGSMFPCPPTSPSGLANRRLKPLGHLSHESGALGAGNIPGSGGGWAREALSATLSVSSKGAPHGGERLQSHRPDRHEHGVLGEGGRGSDQARVQDAAGFTRRRDLATRHGVEGREDRELSRQDPGVVQIRRRVTSRLPPPRAPAAPPPPPPGGRRAPGAAPPRRPAPPACAAPRPARPAARPAGG